MKKFFVIAACAALVACGEAAEEAPEQVPADVATEEETFEVEPERPAPDQAVFTEVFAATCPDAEPVSNAVCRRALGQDNVSCEFGLGEDQYLRHEAMLTPDGEGWALDNAPAICAEHGSHHVDQ
ncbi:hypothetical protein GRI38_06730 [Altererythrobacter aurantiacus]|uniref:Lipoprotein n=1 Tax=Parapontixanthobacter aurantiacus TaxID=1463599 RepID=A0A844ZCW6_9SPHN|nr:hypothetical protein [Parapontixanthobacter aurantiacus]MXO85725.1 hypothetical protein [Parapontixanthobacter aurantiacus]